MSVIPPSPSAWRDHLEAFGGRRRETVTVAVIVGGLVFGGLGLWARGAPASIVPPARATPGPTPSGSPALGDVLVVHVAGEVKRPGVVQLPVGARVVDAIELAGGALRTADLDRLNLAALVVDGTQILVPSKTSAGGPVPVTTPSASTAAVVDLNSADQALLETVPGLGPVKAGAILAYRNEIGSFTSIDQLLEVTGIGPATLESIRPFVSI